MTDPIVASQERIRSWAIDEPRALVEAAAALCRETLDAGGLPHGSPAWQTLRDAFNPDSIDAAPDVREAVCRWDDLVRSEELEDTPSLDDRSDIIKLGIVTWVVKFLAKRLGLLAGSDPIPDFAEWKDRLGQAIEKYVGFLRRK